LRPGLFRCLAGKVRAGILVAVLLAPLCQAQWELGGAIGYGLYRNASVYAPAGKVAAGVRNRFAAGLVVTDDLYEYISGEVRYTYQDGDPFVSAGGVKSNVQGQSHAIHYDLLFHLRRQNQRLRPYVAFGVGAKHFVVSGPAPVSQPLGGSALLTTNDETRLLVTAGLGVRYRAWRNVSLRFDFRDYITPFPKSLIAPAPAGTARGFLQQFTPMFGISYGF